MPAEKRSTSTTVAAAKRPRVAEVADSVAGKRALIAKALSTAVAKDESAMLIEMLPFVFEQPRHHYQERVLETISGKLAGFETSLRDNVEECEVSTVGIDDGRSQRQVVVDGAVAVMEGKASELQVLTSKMESCKFAFKNAKEGLVVAEEALLKVTCRVDEASQKKEKLVNASQLKQKLVTMDIDNVTERGREAELLHKQLELGIVDNNMLNAMQLALSKLKAGRGSFDAMVLKHVDDEVVKALDEVNAVVSEGEVAMAGWQSKIDTGRRSIEEMSQEVADAEVECSNVNASKQECDAALKAAKYELTCFEVEAKTSTASLSAAIVALSDFVSGALSMFNELKDGTVFAEQAEQIVQGPPSKDATITNPIIEQISKVPTPFR